MVYYLLLSITACQGTIPTSSANEKNLNLLAAIIQTKNLEDANNTIANMNASQLILNGTWNSFTGNGTTLDTIVTISAKQGSNGLILTDSSSFGGFSSCGIIVRFNNSSGYYIAQNPENNGACFTGDGNKGKYFKTVFADNGKYWTCSVNAVGVSTIAEAVAISDTTNKTSPGTSGCSGFSWSRLEKDKCNE